MRIGIYFFNLYDMIYAARKLKDMGLTCRVAIGYLKYESDDYDFILRLIEEDADLLEKDEVEVKIIYSDKELFTSQNNLELIKSIKKETEKVIFFMGDINNKIAVIGGYIIYFSSKGGAYDFKYIPDYLSSIWDKVEIKLISKNIPEVDNPSEAAAEGNFNQKQGIIFDCQCKRDILEFIKEYDISLSNNIFLGGFELIEAIYSMIKVNKRDRVNYIIVSSSKDIGDLSLLRELIQDEQVESYCLNPYTLLVNPKEEKDRAISFLTHNGGKKNICLSTANNPEDIINLNELSLMLNISTKEIRRRIDEELMDVAANLIKSFEAIGCIVTLKAAIAFSMAKALAFRGLQYNKQITTKWTCFSGELGERKVDFLISMKDSEDEITLRELLTKYFVTV